MSENNSGKWDAKQIGAGAGLGGGIATAIISLLMSNMSANTKAVQAENRVTLEQVKNISERMNRYEERSIKEFDSFKEKQDKILDLVTSGTKDRFTKQDQELFERKLEIRIQRIEEKIIILNSKLGK